MFEALHSLAKALVPMAGGFGALLLILHFVTKMVLARFNEHATAMAAQKLEQGQEMAEIRRTLNALFERFDAYKDEDKDVHMAMAREMGAFGAKVEALNQVVSFALRDGKAGQ